MSIPEPRMSKPMKPASVAAPMAAPSRAMAAVASDRTATITSPAPIANAAMAAPSMTANGSRPRRLACALARPGERRIERGQESRLGRPVGIDGSGLRSGGLWLEAQVAVIGRRAVDRRVPGTGQLADALERRHREIAIGG